MSLLLLYSRQLGTTRNRSYVKLYFFKLYKLLLTMLEELDSSHNLRVQAFAIICWRLLTCFEISGWNQKNNIFKSIKVIYELKTKIIIRNPSTFYITMSWRHNCPSVLHVIIFYYNRLANLENQDIYYWIDINYLWRLLQVIYNLNTKETKLKKIIQFFKINHIFLCEINCYFTSLFTYLSSLSVDYIVVFLFTTV